MTTKSAQHHAGQASRPIAPHPLTFAEALTVFDWALGPFDWENDLRLDDTRDEALQRVRIVFAAMGADGLGPAVEAVRAIDDSMDEEEVFNLRTFAAKMIRDRPPGVYAKVGGAAR